MLTGLEGSMLVGVRMNDGKVISFVIVCAVTRDLRSRRDRV